MSIKVELWKRMDGRLTLFPSSSFFFAFDVKDEEKIYLKIYFARHACSEAQPGNY
jgi:hypothetical protein